MATQGDVSAREAEVLTALGEHLTNAEISARLFISVRTVESHVSSLLRKLGVADRRALTVIARAEPSRASALPSPLTPFVGRAAEQTVLSAELRAHRLVTAVGPGGVGKTRLALSVAHDLDLADGVWFVDLVPVTDPLMIAPAIADALGLGERPGSSATDDILRWLAGREALLVLDNCEHMVDGVVPLLERLLAGCPRLVVLATSRARLLVPFEHVFAVPGLSGGASGDAVELFLKRAAAGGNAVPAGELDRVAALCEALDGMALAIELAAARYSSLGLDGLQSGLRNRLKLLAGGPRVDDRHRSLRKTMDWSYALLDEADQAVLRRVSVFAQPFTASAAAVVLAGWPDCHLPAVLAGLADQSLLISQPGADGTRYRALETIRQYGGDQLEAAGETEEARARHLRWCLATVDTLMPRPEEGGWRFDAVADELRAALAWASEAHRPEAYRLALGLAHLTFFRGLPGESQRRYEQAAGLAADNGDDRLAADALRSAAGAAEARHFGTDALALRLRAAEAAIRAGDPARAAGDLARNAELMYRGPGLLAAEPPAGAAAALIRRGRSLAGGDPAAETRLLVAEAMGGDVADPETTTLVGQAVSASRRIGDPFAESAALDALTAVQLSAGDVAAAAASSFRRIELLAATGMTPAYALEFMDSVLMASDCAVAAGDLPTAREMAERLRDLPFHREEGHLATARLLMVTTLAGDLNETAVLAEQFREGWERAGRPQASNLNRGAVAAAAAHGLRGDDDARADWLSVSDALVRHDHSQWRPYSGQFFDALVLLHRGEFAAAAQQLAARPPDLLEDWFNGLWRPWYAALWCEAGTLSGATDPRVDTARRAAAGNPVALAVVDRAAALAAGDRDGLTAAADRLEATGCRYQWARTLVMLGSRQGETVLADLGAAPMAWPPG